MKQSPKKVHYRAVFDSEQELHHSNRSIKCAKKTNFWSILHETPDTVFSLISTLPIISPPLFLWSSITKYSEKLDFLENKLKKIIKNNKILVLISKALIRENTATEMEWSKAILFSQGEFVAWRGKLGTKTHCSSFTALSLHYFLIIHLKNPS